MTENRSICCPDASHEDHKKTLLFLSDDSVAVHCKMHGWIRLNFYKNGKKMDFHQATVTVSPIKEKHIDNENMPVLSIGKFQAK